MAPRLLPLLLAAVFSALATPSSLPHSNPLPTPTAHHPTHPQLLDHISVAKTLKDDVADISLKLKDAAVKVHSPLGGGGADGPGGAGGEAAAVGEMLSAVTKMLPKLAAKMRPLMSESMPALMHTAMARAHAGKAAVGGSGVHGEGGEGGVVGGGEGGGGDAKSVALEAIKAASEAQRESDAHNAAAHDAARTRRSGGDATREHVVTTPLSSLVHFRGQGRLFASARLNQRAARTLSQRAKKSCPWPGCGIESPGDPAKPVDKMWQAIAGLQQPAGAAGGGVPEGGYETKSRTGGKNFEEEGIGGLPVDIPGKSGTPSMGGGGGF